MGLVKTRSWGKGDGIISGKEIGENAYQILLPVDRDDDDFVLPKHSQKRSERESFVPSRDKGKARETGVPSGKTMRVRAFGQSIAYPGARHVKLIAQRSQDGRKESVVLHTVPTESALDNLVEQGFGVEGEGAVPRVLHARFIRTKDPPHLTTHRLQASGLVFFGDLRAVPHCPKD
jgi:hypothetical protein